MKELDINVLLRELIYALARVEKPGERIKKKASVTPFNYEVVTGDEILKMEGDTLPSLVDPLFPRQGIIGFAGSSDTGKSSILKQLAAAIARGESEFLGFPLNVRHKSSIYVSTEDDVEAVKVVLKRQKKKGSRSSTFSGMRFLFNSENIFYQIKAELKRKPADVVIIDALSDLVGDLNQSNIIRPFLEQFSNLSKKHECLFIILHHTSKGAEGKVPKKGNLLGSQGFEAKCRMVALLVRDNIEPELRHLCIVKGNYLGDEHKQESFVLKFKDDLTFENTGERKPFDDIKQTESDYQKKKASESKKQEALKLRNGGLNMQQIAESLDVNKSTVSRWLSELKEDDNKAKVVDAEISELRLRLGEFIEKKDFYKSYEELQKKHNEGSKQAKGTILAQFNRFLKRKSKVTFELLAKLLKE